MENFLDFAKRWNLPQKSTPEQNFSAFKIRVFNLFKNIDNRLSDIQISFFCQILGIKEEWHRPYGELDAISTNVIDALENENNPIKLFFILQTIFSLLDFRHPHNDALYQNFKAILNLSDVNLAVTEKDGKVIFYPQGEKRLDFELVEAVLSFLNLESHNHFLNALQFYERKSGADSIKSAESLRRSLEEYLRFKLKNQKGLDANITELLTQLKKDGRDPVVRNVIFQVFSYLDKYFNENSKHNDGDIDEAENEFLIYQTGVLMRYIYKSIP